MQLTNSTTNTFLPKARSSAKHPSPGSEAVPANEGAKSYRERSNDTSSQPASNHQAKLDTTRPVTPTNRAEDLQTRPIFKYQDPKTLPSHAKSAVSVYQGVAEALPPQKVELLGIDIFV